MPKLPATSPSSATPAPLASTMTSDSARAKAMARSVRCSIRLMKPVMTTTPVPTINRTIAVDDSDSFAPTAATAHRARRSSLSQRRMSKSGGSSMTKVSAQ